MPFDTLWGGGGGAGTLTTSARGLIYGALRLLGVLRPGQTANTDSLSDGLAALNELIDGWNTERLTVRVVQRDVYPLDGRESYGIAPQRVEHAGYVDSSGSETPLNVIRDQTRWAAIANKPQTGTPSDVWIEYADPEALAYVHPVPAGGFLALYQWRVLELFAGLESEIALPKGYAIALRYNLALDLAPAFVMMAKIPQPLIADIAAKAAEYKGRIKSLNVPVLELECDEALLERSSFDVLAGR
jgi:hypothetical protein